jgi:RNA 3'-terminal phosphate cyclase (ATP)
MIEIDGSLGEGGGQILRTSLTLSMMTGQPFRISKIRAQRKPKPGLQAQHLACVRAAKEICRANTTGDHLGSMQLTFEPGEIRAGSYHFPIGTAGATSLVLHTIYLPLLLNTSEASEVTIEGGTHVPTSPCYSFLKSTWQPLLSEIGLPLELQLIRPGFYPRGGGRIHVRFEPKSEVKPLLLTEAEEKPRLQIISAVAGLPRKIAVRQADRAVQQLDKHDFSAETEIEEWPGGPASYLGIEVQRDERVSLFTALGAKDKSAEKVADEAVDEALKFLHSPGVVDPHSADQILLPLVFAREASRFRVSETTLHLTTNVQTIQQFLSRNISLSDSTGIVEVAANP